MEEIKISSGRMRCLEAARHNSEEKGAIKRTSPRNLHMNPLEFLLSTRNMHRVKLHNAGQIKMGVSS